MAKRGTKSCQLEETILHKDGSSAVFNIALEKEGEKRKKELLQHGVFVFGRTGLNFLERTKHVAVLVV